MQFRDLIEKIKAAIPDAEKSDLAKAIRIRLGLPDTVDPLDPKYWPVPVYGLNRQSGNVLELPLVVYDDEDNIKAEIAIPVTPMTGDRQEGIKAIIDPLPAGDNVVGSFKIRGHDDVYDADVVRFGGGYRGLCIYPAYAMSVIVNSGSIDINSLLTFEPNWDLNEWTYGYKNFSYPVNLNGAQANTSIIDLVTPVPGSLPAERPLVVNYIEINTEAANTVYFDRDDGVRVTPTVYMAANGFWRFGGPNKILVFLNLENVTILRITTTAATNIGVLVQGSIVG